MNALKKPKIRKSTIRKEPRLLCLASIFNLVIP